MKKEIKLLTAVAVLLLSAMTGLAQKRETVGLVLSGGGAKGIAHVGVIKALEENDIPVTYVTGTSMGAIVGSLYSCGWSPERMMKLFTSKDFGYWSTGTINPDNITRISRLDPTPQWVGVNISLKDSTGVMSMLPTSLISPIPMNIEFLELYSRYTLQCKENFNNLFVPFRCVTSDVYHKHKIVLSKGSLGDAVRASMSFPLVFRPIEMNGVLVYDGGIYDNFPVNVMEEDFNPDFIIGVSVSGPDQKPQQGDIYSQLEDMIIQNNDYSVPAKNGIKIQVPVLQFGVLDFGEAQT
ncbi:MAG: patatin-like phospholipase family protein, partial [Muribaculaceae bacterium]|nr:patatin-like phospholipase family protein [Muribaculaceae bacterium]